MEIESGMDLFCFISSSAAIRNLDEALILCN